MILINDEEHPRVCVYEGEGERQRQSEKDGRGALFIEGEKGRERKEKKREREREKKNNHKFLTFFIHSPSPLLPFQHRHGSRACD